MLTPYQEVKEIRFLWERVKRMLESLEKRDKDGFPDPFVVKSEIKTIEDSLLKIQRSGDPSPQIKTLIKSYEDKITIRLES